MGGSRYHTQWAAQFYVAAELTRRGYLIALTLGNAKATDLLVSSDSGKHFRVEVKGQSKRNFWLYDRVEPQDDLFYILVALGKVGEHPRFNVLSSTEAMTEYDEYKRGCPPDKSEKWKGWWGMKWQTALKYEDQWEKLPV
jgi:hypothetical protein